MKAVRRYYSSIPGRHSDGWSLARSHSRSWSNSCYFSTKESGYPIVFSESWTRQLRLSWSWPGSESASTAVHGKWGGI